jgi:hypothetical protein
MDTKLTWTKIGFMHGACDRADCPVCDDLDSSIARVDAWLRCRLTVTGTGVPDSPWWNVVESNGECYRKLRGNLRRPGFYDRNPDAH